MSDGKLLTKEIAEQFLVRGVFSMSYQFTAIEDAAAESLLKRKGRWWGFFSPPELDLNGLTELSDAAAESLSKYKGDLRLEGLTELSDAAAESLSKCCGILWLGGITELSDAAAESFSKNDSIVDLNEDSFSESAVKILVDADILLRPSNKFH